MNEMRSAALACAAQLAMLKYFPADDLTRAGIMELLSQMAHEPKQLAIFARKVLANCNEWPGPQQLRALWCHHIGAPRDGIHADLPTELVGEQPTSPFRGCAKCTAGWREKRVERDGKVYSSVEQCECRKQAVLADPRVPRELPAAAARVGKLERVDVRMIAAGGGA